MTHAELYEIVKDKPDVWDMVLEFHNGHWADPDETNSWVPESIAESALLGLGVEWLVKNSDVTIHEHLHGGIVVWPQLEPGYDDRPKVIRPTPITAVYAAIAEVKAKA